MKVRRSLPLLTFVSFDISFSLVENTISRLNKVFLFDEEIRSESARQNKTLPVDLSINFVLQMIAARKQTVEVPVAVAAASSPSKPAGKPAQSTPQNDSPAQVLQGEFMELL